MIKSLRDDVSSSTCSSNCCTIFSYTDGKTFSVVDRESWYDKIAVITTWKQCKCCCVPDLTWNLVTSLKEEQVWSLLSLQGRLCATSFGYHFKHLLMWILLSFWCISHISCLSVMTKLPFLMHFCLFCCLQQLLSKDCLQEKEIHSRHRWRRSIETHLDVCLELSMNGLLVFSVNIHEGHRAIKYACISGVVELSWRLWFRIEMQLTNCALKRMSQDANWAKCSVSELNVQIITE